MNKRPPKAYNPQKDLLDEELIAKAMWECLKENDPEGVIDILEAHIQAKNTGSFTGKHTFKSRNPTLQTLAKLVHTTI